MSAVERLDPRRDMGLIRDRIAHLLDNGDDPAPTMADLASRNPIALADLVVGPKAIRHDRWASAALVQAEALEKALAPSALYRRLIEVVPDSAGQVLETAVRRHPGAQWVVALSRRVEGQQAGAVHLAATAGHPSFAQNCWSHASAGHLPGLVDAARTTGRPEPAAALAAHGHLDAAGHAVVATLHTDSDSPVVAVVAAAWGPDPEPVLRCAIPHLRSTEVASALRRQCAGFPSLERFLEIVIEAMVQR